jgi:amino acid transporter
LKCSKRYALPTILTRQSHIFIYASNRLRVPNPSGVPYISVVVTASISLLSCLSCSSGSNTVFVWFQNLTTISTLFTWSEICVTYIKFHKAVQVQGLDRNFFVFRSPFQPYLAYFALSFFAVIIVFKGFYVFSPWSVESFVTSYVGIPAFFTLFFFWKFVKMTKWIGAADVDLLSGKGAIDAIEWPEVKARNALERVWFWVV